MEKKKKTNSKRRRSFWRSYSFVLTLVVLFSVSVVSASAKKYSIENGLIKVQDLWGGNSWSNLSWGASTPGVATEAQFDAQWKALAEDVGIMSASSGGMTLEEFSNYMSIWSAPTGLLNDRLSRYLHVSDNFNQYLDADGVEKTLSTSAQPPQYDLATMLSNALRGINKNMNSGLGSVRSGVSLASDLNHSDLVSLLSGLTGFKDANHSDFSSFQSANHQDLTSGFSVNHQDLTSFKSANHQDITAFKASNHADFLQYIMGSYRNSYFPSSMGIPYSRVENAPNGVLGFIYSPFNSSTGGFEIQNSYSHGLGGILASLLVPMQSDLGKLRYVLASDKDMEIAEKQEPVKDELANQFTGDGAAAVKPGDIGDMAGFSGSLQDSLSTGANAGDVFSFIGGSGGVGFWSQDVANDLDRVPVTASEDEEDYIHFYDSSIISDYLSGGDKS